MERSILAVSQYSLIVQLCFRIGFTTHYLTTHNHVTFMDAFCNENQVDPSLVDHEILVEILALHTVADVLRSSLFGTEDKRTLLNLYRKAQTTKKDRHWMTSPCSRALIKARDTMSEQPFDACPLYLMHFMVSPVGDITFQMKLRLLHTIMYDRTNGSLL